MILCNFCKTQTQLTYLFLMCKHLSCLHCAYQRADFSSQQIECCKQLTRIDVNAMEKIIKSKRIFKNLHENKENKHDFSQQQQFQQLNKNKGVNPESHKYISFQQKQITQSLHKQQLHIQQPTFNPQQKGRLPLQQSKISQLQNILLTQIERVKKFFQSQKQLLKERQEIAIKDLQAAYQKELRQIRNPITPPEIQKISLNLSKKVSALNVKSIASQESRLTISLQRSKDLKDSRQSYDHILKRLETNQQRMKQKIQKHLQTPF